MDGKYRERAKGVWCPLPQAEILVEDKFEARITGKEIGEVAVKAKRATGWTNMFNACPACEYLEEFHLENVGVFCTYPKKANETS